MEQQERVCNGRASETLLLGVNNENRIYTYVVGIYIYIQYIVRQNSLL